LGVINRNPVNPIFRVKTDRMRPMWKTAFLLGCFSIFISLCTKAQCGNTLQSVTYDTSIVGTGNDSHVFTLSQFDPSIGTLVSAKINSTVSLNYGFTLKNVEGVQRNFSVSVGRYDNFTSSALSTPYSNLIDTSIGDFLLNPGDSITKPPYTILSRYSQNDSITSSVVNFLGNGTVAFNYTPITYTNLTGSNIYYYAATAKDTIHFSVTYYYCDNAILANDLILFSAIKENSKTIKLLWSMANPQPGRNYEIQQGDDSSHFADIALIADTGNISYEYDYSVSGHEKGDIYFRLKIISSSGQVKYSEIKMISFTDAGDSKGMFIYPNPCDAYINIVFDKPDNNKDWDIFIYSSNGCLIQKNHFTNASTAHINFRNRLTAGVYFIKAEDSESRKKYLLSAFVR
jgi:type IX secretion system substrate protein